MCPQLKILARMGACCSRKAVNAAPVVVPPTAAHPVPFTCTERGCLSNTDTCAGAQSVPSTNALLYAARIAYMTHAPLVLDPSQLWLQVLIAARHRGGDKATRVRIAQQMRIGGAVPPISDDVLACLPHTALHAFLDVDCAAQRAAAAALACDRLRVGALRFDTPLRPQAAMPHAVVAQCPTRGIACVQLVHSNAEWVQLVDRLGQLERILAGCDALTAWLAQLRELVLKIVLHGLSDLTLYAAGRLAFWLDMCTVDASTNRLHGWLALFCANQDGDEFDSALPSCGALALYRDRTRVGTLRFGAFQVCTHADGAIEPCTQWVVTVRCNGRLF